jgi:hypothetical protein
MNSLEEEFYSAQERLRPNHVAKVKSAGVCHDLLSVWVLCGVARVTFDGAHYWPDPDNGVPAIITPVRVEDPRTPESSNSSLAIRLGHIVDLVAWRLSRPSAFALRHGSATWLGAIGPQLLDPEPVLVHRTPLNWLRSGGAGICLLTPSDIERSVILLGFRGIVAEDVEHRRELGRVLERRQNLPPIYIADRKRSAPFTSPLAAE